MLNQAWKSNLKSAGAVVEALNVHDVGVPWRRIIGLGCWRSGTPWSSFLWRWKLGCKCRYTVDNKEGSNCGPNVSTRCAFELELAGQEIGHRVWGCRGVEAAGNAWQQNQINDQSNPVEHAPDPKVDIRWRGPLHQGSAQQAGVGIGEDQVWEGNRDDTEVLLAMNVVDL